VRNRDRSTALTSLPLSIKTRVDFPLILADMTRWLPSRSFLSVSKSNAKDDRIRG
jgi:hypothetical protein